MKKAILLIIAVVMTALLAVSVSAEGEEKIVVVLDPGHGGHDPGTTVGTRYESEYNYDVALLLKDKLEETGKFEVYLTRARSEYKVYLLRAAVADKYDADILLSLHFNSNPALDPTLNGVEVLASVLDEWCPRTLAESICASMSKKCGLKNGGIVRKYDTGDSRGVYYWNEEIGWDIPGVGVGRVSDYYSMIAWGTKLGFPSIIVEHAYLSNPSDLALCDSKDGLEMMAQAEADAIIKHYTGHTHTYGAESCDRRANCCLGGVYSRKCTVCGHRTDVRHTEPAPQVHAWTVESRSVTCTADGYVNRECQISRNLSEKGYDYISIHRESETYPATGHALVTEVDTPASHAVDGLLREVCTNCGEVFDTVRYGDPHIYNMIDSVPVSCEEDGYEKYECSVCAHTYTDEYPATGHSYVSDGEVLTCASDGTKEYACEKCGDVMSENVELPPHSFELTEDTVPTCEVDGRKVWICKVCDLTDTEIIAALGHDYPEEGVEAISPTYFAKGETVYVCANDTMHRKIEEIPVKPGGIYIIIAAVSAVAVVVSVAVLVVIGGKRHRVPKRTDDGSVKVTEKERPDAAGKEAVTGSGTKKEE